MIISRVNNYDNTSFQRLSAAKKGANYLMKQINSQTAANSDKLYGIYHGVVQNPKKAVNLPPLVQSIRKYLAADFS